MRSKETVHRIGGNGFCGCARRTLLMLLQDRARSLGMRMEFGREITDLDAFLLSFRELPHGIFIAHAYQYEPGRSTWVLETDAKTWAAAGLDAVDEAASAVPGRGVRRGPGGT